MSDLFECTMKISVRMKDYDNPDTLAQYEYFDEARAAIVKRPLKERFTIGVLDAGSPEPIPEEELRAAVDTRLPAGHTMGALVNDAYKFVDEPPPPHMVWCSSYQLLNEGNPIEVPSASSPDLIGELVVDLEFVRAKT